MCSSDLEQVEHQENDRQEGGDDRGTLPIISVNATDTSAAENTFVSLKPKVPFHCYFVLRIWPVFDRIRILLRPEIPDPCPDPVCFLFFS